MLKHFTHVHYGCGKLSKVVYSLNHDIMASFTFNSHQELPKSDPALAVLRCKGALICLCTSLKGAKTFYICPLWMWEAIKGGLQPQPWHHGIISTWQSPRTQNCQNLTQLCQCNSVRVHLCAYVPHWKVCKQFIYVHYECGKQSKVV